MSTFEACGLFFGFLGIIGGAIVGATLCSAYGTFASIGGAVGGGFVGMIVGTLFGYVSLIAYAFARAVAKVYWEVLTGRLKFPSSSTKAERRYLFVFLSFVFVVSMIISVYLDYFGSKAQRSRSFGCAVAMVGTYVVGLLILHVHYRRHTAQKDHGKDE